ncbi:MAG: proton-conducting transporter membrane subunit [Acetobacteraceae bacterium]|jgi:multicomponent Na+:H+ antiporter subunit A
MSAVATMLLGASLAVPLAMLLGCLSSRIRMRMPSLLAIAPVPALLAAMLARGGTLVLPQILLGLQFALDTPGALLLGVAALLWTAGGFYASTWLRGSPDAGRFATWWLLTLTGSIGVFIAADLVSFYLVFSMVSLAGYGLIIDDGTPSARRNGLIYVAIALLGEAFLLMAFVMLAQAVPNHSLLIRDAVAALPTSPWRTATLTLMLLGFGAKIGIVPFHVWMPLAYRSAPIPAAAVLSGAAVKAGVIGFIQFLPLHTALPAWGEALTAAGFVSAFYGVAIGITQSNPKTVLAYSSVSQMGVIAAVLGMGLAVGDNDVAFSTSFYAAHHILAKGALFLAVGVAQTTGPRRVWTVLVPAAILALGLGGLPLTGGALAKLAVKAPLGDGAAGMLGTMSSVGTTLLMLHFLSRLAATRARAPALPTWRLSMLWLVTALASVVVPWVLFLTVIGGTAYDALSPAVLWSLAWPVLLGALLALGLRRWGDSLPLVPEGDVVGSMVRGSTHFARVVGLVLERLDAVLRQWPVAGVLLLTLAVLLAGLMQIGR